MFELFMGATWLWIGLTVLFGGAWFLHHQYVKRTIERQQQSGELKAQFVLVTAGVLGCLYVVFQVACIVSACCAVLNLLLRFVFHHG